MNGILALLAGSVVVGMHGHRPLLWLAGRGGDPTVLLTGWILSTVGLVASTVATVTLLTLPADEHPAAGIFALAGGCWTALSSGSVPGWREALAASGLLGTVVLLVRVAWAVSARVRQRRARAPHLARLRLLASASPSSEPLWVRDDRPLAMSIGGRPGVIVMSDGLRRCLRPQAVEAALEHERAHLRGRHHALVTVAEVVGSALPVCPLLRAAPAAIKDLVELAADAAAARRCGPEAVREALCRLTAHPGPVGSLAMAGRLTQERLHRLGAADASGNRGLRIAGCIGMSIAALLLPAATGWLAVNVVGCVVT